jgi:sugar lactone lactonase YvrE
VAFNGSTPSVNQGSQALGSTSAATSLSFTIAASANTQVGSIAVLTTGIPNKDFTQASGSTCAPGAYTASTKCNVNVSFKPLFAGLRLGAVVFFSGANRSGTVLATVPVYGVGSGPQAAFEPAGAPETVGGKIVSPEGVAVDAGGNVFVADLDSQKVFKVTPGGAKTVVGSGFSAPQAVAVDGAGNVYVGDTFTALVSKVTPSGIQTTIGTGFSYPIGVAVDGAGNVYVADPFVDAVIKVPPTGSQTMVGGTLVSPQAVAVDAAGDVYVTDDGPGKVFRITPAGKQSNAVDNLDNPDGIALDGAGNFYIADTYKSKVIQVDRATPPSVHFDTTKKGSTSADSPQDVYVENIGNAALKFSAVTFAKDFPEGFSSGKECASGGAVQPASNCTLPIDFEPVSSLGGKSSVALKEIVTVTVNNLNVNQTDKVHVSGTETAK